MNSKTPVKSLIGKTKIFFKSLSATKIFETITATFIILAEISNVGIIIEVIAHWSPIFAAMIAFGPVAYLTLIADPLIYFFRALIRLTRIIGTTFFNMQFIDSIHLTPKERLQQTIGDVLSLVFFILSICFFAGLMASPIGITIAWTMGLCGLMVVGYTDHHLPQKAAERHLKALKLSISPSKTDINEANAYNKGLRSAKHLYIALLLGLTLLLICGSAAAFAPIAVIPILLTISKIASIYLGIIAVSRFGCWVYNKSKKPKHSPENIPENTPTPEFTEYVPIPKSKFEPKPKKQLIRFPFKFFDSEPDVSPKSLPVEIEIAPIQNPVSL